LRSGGTNTEFDWRIESRGEWDGVESALRRERKPNWVRKRDEVIARAYLGEVEFDPVAVGHWFDSARALQSVSGRLVCFIHPPDPAILAATRGSCSGDALDRLVGDIRRALGVEVLPWDRFDLVSADFRDVTHMRTRDCSEKLTRQLAVMLGL